MNPDEANEEEINRRLDRLPQGAEQANGQESRRTALDVTRRVHWANPSHSPAINPESGEIWRLSEEIKLLEAEALSEWASKTKHLFDTEDFTRRWFEYGNVEGGEHQLFQAGGTSTSATTSPFTPAVWNASSG